MRPGSVLRQLAKSFRRLFSCIPRRAKEPVPDVEEDFSLGVPQGAALSSWVVEATVDSSLRRPDFDNRRQRYFKVAPQARPVKPSSGASLAMVKGAEKPR